MAEKQKDVDAMLDRLLEGRSPEEVVGSGGLLEDLTKRLLERALEGELSDHLGYEKHDAEGRNGGNSRNGLTRKRVKTDTAEMEIEVPRDRDGSFEPRLVAKGQRRLPGFDER
jgi:transposase-like protein